ncbi:DgyrCDS14121 [Dimorphilus gyrociliatus]|uniref:TBC1 domain family member 30 n=1 Tax=Dimorphilus gyrociliatus TaxID=2664684 RepID=A0A7I8WD11_9ANNE|nr:DgyrCDS14121 [Dimorphilus gyrociliatus]
MRGVCRLPCGIPAEFRKKVWLALADKHLAELKLDWDKTKKFAFNERSNPDDNKLGVQIVKDLHRTGCSGFSGQDNDHERAMLKRVLLAYARWNKRVGYCQGFNVLAALILEVVERKEDDALKIMIYVIDAVLPESYFDNNLRALSVDMAVFRDLIRMQLPQLSKHLDTLQARARDESGGTVYEPPLTNVFTMQWFLTMFATCLPKETALRVWDCIVLYGSEILLRTGTALWGKLQNRILGIQSADEFYTAMGSITTDTLNGLIVDADDLVKAIFDQGPLPLPQLGELREKYTFNITPFTALATGKKKGKNARHSDDEEIDEEDIAEQIGCFSGMFPVSHGQVLAKHRPLNDAQADVSKASPGAFAVEKLPQHQANIVMERTTLDVTLLQKQYKKFAERQKQANVIMMEAASASLASKGRTKAQKVLNVESPIAMNHLLIGHKSSAIRNKNKAVAIAPKIAEFKSTLPQPKRRNSSSTSEKSKNPNSPTKVEISRQNSADPEEYVTKLTYETAKKSHTSADNSKSQKSNFSPFQSKINNRVAKNGIKLGLYSPDFMYVIDDHHKDVQNGDGVKNITRAQINACLNRQYQAGLKGQKCASPI